MSNPSSGEPDAEYRASDFHGLDHSISRRCCFGGLVFERLGVARGGCRGATQALLESKVNNLASRSQTSPATAGHPGQGVSISELAKEARPGLTKPYLTLQNRTSVL